MGTTSRFPIKNSSCICLSTYNSSNSNSAIIIDLDIWPSRLHPYLLCYWNLCHKPHTPSLVWSIYWFRLSKYGLHLLWLCSDMFGSLLLCYHALALSSFIKHWWDCFIITNSSFSNIYDRTRSQFCSRSGFDEINKQTKKLKCLRKIKIR